MRKKALHPTDDRPVMRARYACCCFAFALLASSSALFAPSDEDEDEDEDKDLQSWRIFWCAASLSMSSLAMARKASTAKARSEGLR